MRPLGMPSSVPSPWSLVGLALVLLIGAIALGWILDGLGVL